MATPEQRRTVREVRAAAGELREGAEQDRVLSPAFAVEATRVARGPGGCLYRIDPPPEVVLVEDAPVRLFAGARRTSGRLGPVADESCLVETVADLGPRLLDATLRVDGAGPARVLAQRLDALAAPVPQPPTFRFDQAALALGAPGGRIRDRIADAAGAADRWSLDDRAGDVLHAALRQRWAQVQPPPHDEVPGAGTADHPAVDLVARLLDRLLELDANVLFVAPGGHAVDRTVGALCQRLIRAGRLRSGVVQRVGPLAPGAVRDRYGPYVDAAAIADDLRLGLEDRLAELDRFDRQLRYDEAERRVAELDRDAAELSERLDRTPGGGRPGLSRRRPDADALIVRRHEVRKQRESAAREADRIATELAGGGASGRTRSAEALLGPDPGPPAARRLRLAQLREDLAAARDGVAAELRDRCRLVATTTRSAYTRDLPRTTYDVVVIAGPASPPEAYWLAGLSERSVVSVGDAGSAPREAAGARAGSVALLGGLARRRRAGRESDAAPVPHPVRQRWWPGPASP